MFYVHTGRIMKKSFYRMQSYSKTFGWDFMWFLNRKVVACTMSTECVRKKSFATCLCKLKWPIVLYSFDVWYSVPATCNFTIYFAFLSFRNAYKDENWAMIIDLAFLKLRVYANPKVGNLKILNVKLCVVTLGLNVLDGLNYLTDILLEHRLTV